MIKNYADKNSKTESNESVGNSSLVLPGLIHMVGGHCKDTQVENERRFKDIKKNFFVDSTMYPG